MEGGTAVVVEWQVIQLDGANVQSGTSSIASGSLSANSTIRSLNSSNSVIFFTSKGGASVNGIERDYYVRGSYLSSTEIQFSRTGTNSTVDISWFAVEMIDGTKVQSGFTSVPTTSTTVSATLGTTVDSTKTMILVSYDTTGFDAAYQDSGTFSSIFLDSSTIQFQRYNHENHPSAINWFTMEFQ